MSFSSHITAAIMLLGAAVFAQRPTHLWEFDAAGAERLRSSIRGDGEVLRPPLPPALVFRSRDDRVVPHRSIRNARLPQAAITVDAWVMLDAPRQWGGIFSALQDNGGFEKGVLLGYRGKRFCFALASKGSDDGDGKMTYITGSSGFTPGRFQHVAGVYDGKQMRLYVDGKLEATSNAQNGPILYPRRAVVELGAYHDDDEDFPFAGLLGRVRIWNRALDAASIEQQFASDRQRFTMPSPAKAQMWRLTATRRGLENKDGSVTAQGPGKDSIEFDSASGPPSLRLSSDTTLSATISGMPSTAWSIDATFSTGANRRRQTIVSANGIELSILDGKLRFGVGDTFATIGTGVFPYRWHHAAATWDGSLLRLYLDGVGRASARSRVNRIAPGETLRIGKGMVGRLHEVNIGNRTWSAIEVRDRFDAKKAAFPQPLRLALGPIAEFTGPGSAQIRWRGPPGAKSTWVEMTDTDGQLQRVAVRMENGLSVADVARMRPGLAYDYRILIEAKDGRQGATDTFRLDTDFAYPSPDLRKPGKEDGRFAALVAKIPTRKGYAVILGGNRELAVRIAEDTEMQVVLLEPDENRVQDLRRWFDQEGLYGVQVSVLRSRFDALKIGSDLANVVVVATDEKVSDTELERITRPHGGVVMNLSGEMLLKLGAKKDAGDWTHQYGSGANTASSGDELVGGPLELQWFGRPGPRPMMDRGARAPAPLATNGRLFIHGDRRLLALDAYNGTILWGLEIPALRRTNIPRDCSNITANGDDLFAAVVDRLWRLDAQTGRLEQTYEIPENLRPSGDPAWGFVHATDRSVIGTATKVAATYRGAEGEWYDKPGADAEDVLGSALFALDRKTGNTLWSYRRGMIVHPTITIDRDVLYFVEDRAPSKASLQKSRLVSQTGVDQYLVAVELPTGHKVWERKYDFRKFKQAFYLSVSAGVLVAVGTSGSYHVHAFDSSTGTPMWQHNHKWKRDHHGGGLQHPVIIGDVIYVESKGLDLRKGNVVRDDLPDRRGCGTMSGSGKSIFFRHYDHTVWDLETDVRTTLPGIRSGCWLSLIPAGGLLLAPESSSGCSCANPIQTSVAYRPKSSK